MFRLVHFYVALFCEKTHKVCSFLKTYLRFKGNGVVFRDFKTSGVPIVKVEKKGVFSISEHFAMNNGISANQIGFATPCVFVVRDGCTLRIGRNVGMSQTSVVALADITIGDYVKFGGGVKIYTSDFHSLDYKKRRIWNDDKESRVSKSITIEDDVFVGAGSTILKGVRIGARSIIGANSVVTKDVPSDEIWAGNPAKFVRSLKSDLLSN